MQLLEEITTDLSAGMYDSVAPTRFPRAAVASITNGRMKPDGTVERRWGSIRTHAAVLEAGIGYGAAHFRTAAGDDKILAFFGTKAFVSDDLGVTWADVTDALTLREDYYTFAEMRVGSTNYVFATNGSDVLRCDGTTLEALPGAPSGPTLLAAHENRLWVTGHSGVLVQASKIANPEVWTSPDGLTVQVRAAPTGLFSAGPHLLVFDSEQTSYIDGYGQQTITVNTGSTGFSPSVGCVAFRTIVGVGDNGVCWLSKRGVEYYTAGGGITLISKNVQVFLESIDWVELYSNPGRPSAVYDPIEQNYCLAISTTGARNNRTLVLNLRQNVDFQRPGPRAAATIDQPLGESAGDVLFAVDSDGYLVEDLDGAGMTVDSHGYASLATGSDPGDPVSVDAAGYLSSVTNDTLPATFFMAPGTAGASTLYSLGYDGFVRCHHGVDKDDMLSDGTGGTDVTMVVRSRPFLFGRPKQQKRTRTIHVASLQETAATLTLLVRGANSVSVTRTVDVPAVAQNQAYRIRSRTKLDADAPQAEVRTSDRVRLSLIGLTAGLLREAA